MSDQDAGSRTSKRVAGQALGGLAVGALLAVGQPALAAGGEAAEPAGDAGSAAADARSSIRDQFSRAFTPGVIDEKSLPVAILIPEK